MRTARRNFRLLRLGFLEANGIEVVDLNAPTCIQIMQDLIAKNPALWNEDIGCEANSFHGRIGAVPPPAVAFPSKPFITPEPARNIRLGEQMSQMYGRPIGPTDVARALSAAGVKYVLVGAHAANAYVSDPRSTVDVDIVAAHPKKARDVLAAAFPELTIEEHPVVIRFKDAGHEAIDMIRPESGKIVREALKRSRTISIARVPVVIPTVEAVLAMKFNSVVTLTRRRSDRVQDVADFLKVVEANAALDLKILEQLGEMCYLGGGADLLRAVDDARHDRPLSL